MTVGSILAETVVGGGGGGSLGRAKKLKCAFCWLGKSKWLAVVPYGACDVACP